MVVAATGFFDGVHKGHSAVLERLKQVAQEQHKESAVITFWPHPRTVLQQDAHSLRLLNSLHEKRERVLAMGIDHFWVVDFSRQFSKLSTEEFMREYLIGRYGVSALVIGYDHKLGNSALQSQQQMIDIATSLGLETLRVEEFQLGETIISSTKIRTALQSGEVSLASDLLGYNYKLHGVVVAGKQLGRTIGFPTANMQLYEPLKLIPGNGVYMVDVHVLGEKYQGVCNIGTRPTVGNNADRTIETHILNFDEDIYGLEMSIEFVKKIRDEKKFGSMEELRQQIIKDKDFVKLR